MTDRTRRMPAENDLEQAILDLVARLGPGKTAAPAEAAQALVGKDPEAWGRVMPLVRRVAIRLMKEGRIAIRRKGRVVDPDDFRGVYRIGPAGGEE